VEGLPGGSFTFEPSRPFAFFEKSPQTPANSGRFEVAGIGSSLSGNLPDEQYILLERGRSALDDESSLKLKGRREKPVHERHETHERYTIPARKKIRWVPRCLSINAVQFLAGVDWIL
jgi:hypothetical protein